MKLHHILFILLLLSGIIAVVCTYYFGIVPRYEAYQALVDEENRLRSRIGELDKKFSRTQPAVVVDAWQQQIQPWSQAASGRVSYFDTLKDDQRFNIVVPQEDIQFPKFWYEKERRERMEALATELEAANLVVNASISSYEPPGPTPGWNPSKEDVEGWLKNYEFAASFIREMINAKAEQVNNLVIWPQEPIISTAEGTIQRERAGYSIVISTENFSKYLSAIHHSDTFTAIDALRVTKAGALSDEAAPLSVEFILNRTRFIPAETAEGDGVAGPAIRRRAAEEVDPQLAAVLGRKTAGTYTEEELARIRALGDQQDPGFFRGILRWFGI